MSLLVSSLGPRGEVGTVKGHGFTLQEQRDIFSYHEKVFEKVMRRCGRSTVYVL